ncbi:GTP 3',8-cyclase MoaA [Methanogenium organophilum]|uniref:Probable GTP 3',8-cyclase n=1 Tax=Methanogenium organophilum TaxID=2199 RepID=A0A9X9S3K8_METOG|nr:GTP 3',8-cyclase MoaA [Methanogenium organophilum]WAI00868.1 GTP 3',8-cyclase MoaA [Methanogenium organophilum]
MILKDKYGRRVTNLRISLTPKCNLNCMYCHAEGEVDPKTLMSAEDIGEIMRVAKLFEMRSIKFTGGEPLMRDDLVDIVSMVPEGMEASLTTNGTILEPIAQDLKDAGLSRVNISLDSLKPDRYKSIAGRDMLSDVLAGIDAAIDAGLTPVKLNVVLMEGVNDDEIPDFIRYAANHKHLILQFIELMDEFRECPYHMELTGLEDELQKTAKTIVTRRMHHRKKYCLEGAEIEIVRPMHNTEFCAFCNRLRVTSDGCLKPCLMRNDNHVDIRGLRGAELEEKFREAVSIREPYYC